VRRERRTLATALDLIGDKRKKLFWFFFVTFVRAIDLDRIEERLRAAVRKCPLLYR